VNLIYAFPEPLPLERARGLQVVHTVAALAEAGVNVQFAYAPVAGAEPFHYYGVERPANVMPAPIARSLSWPLSRVHSNRLFFSRLRRRFSAELAQQPLMVRHIKLAALVAQQLPRSNFLYEAHEVFGDTASASRRDEHRRMEALVMARAGAVVTNSAATAQRLRELYAVGGIQGLGDGILEVIPNGVTRPETLPAKPWVEAARHVVYAGSFFPWKGAAELVAAAASLPGCRINMIGGEDKRIAEFKSMLVSGGAEVVFSGHMPHVQVMQQLAGACIAVLPNRDDADSAFTSPIKLFEYMATGCAIVASDLPSLREILAEDEAAWVKPGDAVSLAEGIRALAENPERARLLGERVRAKSAAYTWAARGAKLKAVLERMGTGRRAA
jgi:glycosyltransferase involved in cell wall biosynthesis